MKAEPHQYIPQNPKLKTNSELLVANAIEQQFYWCSRKF